MFALGAVSEILQAVLGDDQLGDQIDDRVDLALVDAQHARQTGPVGGGRLRRLDRGGRRRRGGRERRLAGARP